METTYVRGFLLRELIWTMNLEQLGSLGAGYTGRWHKLVLVGRNQADAITVASWGIGHLCAFAASIRIFFHARNLDLLYI